MSAKTLTPIKKVLSTMVYEPHIPENAQMQIRELTESIEKTRKLNGQSFFAFESFDEEIADTIKDLQNQKLNITMAIMGYPEMDYTFLSWRKNDTKMPAFMVLNLDSNQFSISVEPYNVRDEKSGAVSLANCEWSIEPDLPNAMAMQYQDAVKHLASISAKSYGWSEIEVSTEFRGGIMPQGLREKIQGAQKAKIFDQIFVIAEATEWKIEEVVRVKGDPLVVGWISSSEKMYLIGVYDPTPLEEYIKTQMIK